MAYTMCAEHPLSSIFTFNCSNLLCKVQNNLSLYLHKQCRKNNFQSSTHFRIAPSDKRRFSDFAPKSPLSERPPDLNPPEERRESFLKIQGDLANVK